MFVITGFLKALFVGTWQHRFYRNDLNTKKVLKIEIKERELLR